MRILLLDKEGQPINEGKIEHVGGSIGDATDYSVWTTESEDDYFFKVGTIEPGQQVSFTASTYTDFDVAGDWTCEVALK